MAEGFVRSHPSGAVVALKVLPRASRNEIGPVQGNELKVKVTAPPVDSAANEALVAFLAETLGCPRRSVQLLKGQTSRHKQILVEGLTVQQVFEKLVSR